MRIAFSIFACIGLMYLGLLFMPASGPVTSVAFYQDDKFEVIAHGNGRALLPGNTLEAAVNALTVGTDILELDIHLTADNQLVVRHDEIIDTTTKGTGRIADMTLAELQQFDVGFHEIDYPNLRAPDGIVIPTLESLFKRMPSSRYLIELKPVETRAADHLCQLVKDNGLVDQVVVGSFHSSVLKYFRQTCPGIPTSMGQSEVAWMVVLNHLGLTHLLSPEAVSVQVPMSYAGVNILTPALVKAAHKLNLRIDVWTINDPGIMQSLIEMGVDGVITDRPDLLSALNNKL